MVANGDSSGPAEKEIDEEKKKVDGPEDPGEQTTEKSVPKEDDAQNQKDSDKKTEKGVEKNPGEKISLQDQADKKPDLTAATIIHQAPKKKEASNEPVYQSMLANSESKSTKPPETGNGSSGKVSGGSLAQEKQKETASHVDVEGKPADDTPSEAAKGTSSLEPKVDDAKGKSSSATQNQSEKKIDEAKKKESAERILPENKASKGSQSKASKKTPSKVKSQDDEKEVAEVLFTMKSKGTKGQAEPGFPLKQSKSPGNDDSMLNKASTSVRGRSKPGKGAQDMHSGKSDHQSVPPPNLAPIPKSPILPSSSPKIAKNQLIAKKTRPLKGKDADDGLNSSRQIVPDFTKSGASSNSVPKVSKSAGQNSSSKQTGQLHINGKRERDQPAHEKSSAKAVKTEGGDAKSEKSKDSIHGATRISSPPKPEHRSNKTDGDGHGANNSNKPPSMLSPDKPYSGLSANMAIMNSSNSLTRMLAPKNHGGLVQEPKGFSGVDKTKASQKANGESNSSGIKKEKDGKGDRNASSSKGEVPIPSSVQERGPEGKGYVENEKGSKESVLAKLSNRGSAGGGSSAFHKDRDAGRFGGKQSNCATHVYIARMIEKEQQSVRQKAIETQFSNHEHRGPFANPVQAGARNIGMQGVNVSAANRATASHPSIPGIRNEKNMPNASQLALSALMSGMTSSPAELAAALPQNPQQGQNVSAPNADLMKQLRMQGLDPAVAIQIANGAMGSPLPSIATASNSDNRKANSTSRQVPSSQQSEQMSSVQQNLNPLSMLQMGIANGSIPSSTPSSQGFNLSNMGLHVSSPFAAINFASGSMGNPPHYDFLLQAQNAQPQNHQGHGPLAENGNSASPSPPIGQSNIAFNPALAAQVQQVSGNTQHFPNMSGIGQASAGASVSQPQLTTDNLQMQAQHHATLMSMLACTHPTAAHAFLGMLNQSQSNDPASMQSAKNNITAESTNESSQMNANQQQHAAISSLSRQTSGGSAIPNSNLSDLHKMILQIGQNPSLQQQMLLAAQQQQQSQMGNIPQSHIGQGQQNMVLPGLQMGSLTGMPLPMTQFPFIGNPMGMQLPGSNQQQQPR